MRRGPTDAEMVMSRAENDEADEHTGQKRQASHIMTPLRLLVWAPLGFLVCALTGFSSVTMILRDTAVLGD